MSLDNLNIFLIFNIRFKKSFQYLKITLKILLAISDLKFFNYVCNTFGTV